MIRFLRQNIKDQHLGVLVFFYRYFRLDINLRHLGVALDE